MPTFHPMRLFMAMMSAAMLAGSLAACSASQSAQDLVAEAGEYQRKGDHKAAVIQLKNALQKNPDNAEARLLLGTIYLETGDPQSAEKEVRKAMELGDKSQEVVSALAKALQMQGKFDEVLNMTHAGFEARRDAAIAVVRGNAFLALGKAAEAKKSFEQALEWSAAHPDALVGLAKHALMLKDVDAAAHYSDQAVRTNPDNVDAWFFKGNLMRAQAKAEGALAAYGEVLKRKADHPGALVARAGIEIESGNFDAARASLEAVRKAGISTVSVLHTQALLDYKLGKHAAALDSLQKILQAVPEHMPAQLLAGAVQYALGATEQAEQHLKIYLEKKPNDLHARKLLAATLLKNGEHKRAFAVASAAAKDAPQDAQLLALAGESLLQEKNFSGAADYFQQASAIAPQDAVIRIALGKSRLGQGDIASAVAELESASALEATPGQASTALVLAYMQQKQYDKALATVATLEKAQPKSAHLQHMKGGIILAKKDVQGARRSYALALAHDPAYFPAVASLAGLDLLDKKPEEARKRFEELLALDKKNVQAMIALGKLALSQRQNDEATRWFERAHAANSDDAGTAAQLAMHYLRLGQKQKALVLAQKLQASNPSGRDALDLLARMQFANDDKGGALESYEKLASLNPSSAATYMRISSIHLAMQNRAAAADALKKALSLQPDYIEAQVALAGVEQGWGHHDQALSIARAIQKRLEKSPVGHALEGELLLAQKKPAPAAAAFERAFAMGRTSGLAIKLHRALLQADRGKEAQAHIAQWLKAHPADLAVHGYLADLYLAGEQYKLAIQHCESILQREPGDVRVLNNLAWAYQQVRDERALPLAEKAHAASPDNPAVLDTLGWILVERGDAARGAGFLQKASTLAPDAPEIRYRLALALMKSGEREKARGELQRLLDTGKDFPKAKDARALLSEL